MASHYKSCPKCGGALTHLVDLDITVGQACLSCGWERTFGHVGGVWGSQYLVQDEEWPVMTDELEEELENEPEMTSSEFDSDDLPF